MNYLIRYFMLICIGAYMAAEAPTDFQQRTFQQWMDERPEISKQLAGLVYPEQMETAVTRKPNPANRRSTGSNVAMLSPNNVAS